MSNNSFRFHYLKKASGLQFAYGELFENCAEAAENAGSGAVDRYRAVDSRSDYSGFAAGWIGKTDHSASGGARRCVRWHDVSVLPEQTGVALYGSRRASDGADGRSRACLPGERGRGGGGDGRECRLGVHSGEAQGTAEIAGAVGGIAAVPAGRIDEAHREA